MLIKHYIQAKHFQLQSRLQSCFQFKRNTLLAKRIATPLANCKGSRPLVNDLQSLCFKDGGDTTNCKVFQKRQKLKIWDIIPIHFNCQGGSSFKNIDNSKKQLVFLKWMISEWAICWASSKLQVSFLFIFIKYVNYKYIF